MQAFPGATGEIPSLLYFGLNVLAICIALCVACHLVPILVLLSAAEDRGDAHPRLIRRLPSEFSGEILRLSVAGHKVQVFTTEGMFELRMRFADAVDEVGEMVGFCVHRSHWVSRASINKVLMNNGRPVLSLHNGDEVPVSRKYQGNLTKAGLL